ncbi:MAG TPA: hypothetical protein VJR89_43570, partial [Polyangiales bacterium]|nr:hypothetical protein [Polyangiales bacterium]
ELRVDGEPDDFYDQQTYIDQGRPIGSGLYGRGRDRIYDSCEHNQGEHTVQLRAALPDGTELSTPELRVDLSCGGGGCNLSPAARGGSAGWLVSLAAAALLLRERRRAS